MLTKDTELINTFLSDFTRRLISRFPKEIDFILLFGSAARGEFRAGVSDVDIIVQVKKNDSVAGVRDYANEIFWELDSRHGTRLREVCSTKKDDFLGGLEENVNLYKPFEVIGPNDINWAQGKITGPALGPFAAIAPIYQFAKKIKREGKILYGRNIINEIACKGSLSDKLKGIAIPYLLSAIALSLSVFIPTRALKYSIKSVLYSVDGQIAILDAAYAKTSALNTSILRTELGDFYSSRLAREALYAKRNFDRVSKEWSYADKVAFCFQTPVYIAYNNLLSLLAFVRKK